MIERVGRLGDRLLGLVVPRTDAAAVRCWEQRRIVDCGGGWQRLCERTCCSITGCGGWRCGPCFG